jgi:hypothetical protein
VTGQHGGWAGELTTFEKYAKAWLAALFGLSPAVVVGVLALFGVHIEAATWAALLGVLGPVLAVAGVVVGPANKTDPTPILVISGAGPPVQQGPTLHDGETGTLQDPPASPPATP